MCNSALYRRRLARTEFLVNIDKSVGVILGLVLLEDSLLETVILAEEFVDLLIRAYTEGTDESCYRDLSVLVDTNVNDIV